MDGENGNELTTVVSQSSVCQYGALLETCVGGGEVSTGEPEPDVCLSDVSTGEGNQIVHRPEYSAKSCNQRCCPGDGLDSGVVWCNWCVVEGATITGEGTTLGDPRLTCECEDGLFWQFEDTGTYTVTIPSTSSFDSVIISQSNLCEVGATIRIYANGLQQTLMSHTGDEAIIPAQSDCDIHSRKKGCDNIPIYLPDCVQGTEVTIEIESSGVRTIGRITVGLWMDIDLKPGHKNIFRSTKFKRENKSTGCGWFPTSKKPRMLETELNMPRLPSSVIKEEFMPLIQYWEDYPVWFAMDRMGCPNDIGYAILGDIDGTDIETPCREQLNIPITVNVHGGIY